MSETELEARVRRLEDLEEIRTLKASAKQILKLAKDKKTEYPTEVTYVHTARDAVEGLITKVEVVTVEEASEAEAAAMNIEKRLESWGKLKDQMVDELKQRRVRVEDMKNHVNAFVDMSRGLLVEVFAILQ